MSLLEKCGVSSDSGKLLRKRKNQVSYLDTTDSESIGDSSQSEESWKKKYEALKKEKARLMIKKKKCSKHSKKSSRHTLHTVSARLYIVYCVEHF